MTHISVARGKRIVISNTYMEKGLSFDRGSIRTAYVMNRKTGERLNLNSEEFIIHASDGTVLRGHLFSLQSYKIDENGCGLLVSLIHKKSGVAAEVSFHLGNNDFYLTKTVSLRGINGRALVLNKFEVERFSVAPRLLPGESRSLDVFKSSGADDNNQGVPTGRLGQPIYINNEFFVGLEYPAARNEYRNGNVSLFHLPGKKIGPAPWTSKAAVFGVAVTGNVHNDFLEYIHRIRKPTKPFVRLNTGGEVQIYNPVQFPERNMTLPQIINESLAPIKTRLTDKHGICLKSYELDAGWHDPDTLYAVDKKKFPDNFASLLRTLRGMQSGLGLWLSATTPLSPALLKETTMKRLGYEIASNPRAVCRYPCLSAPRYNRAIRRVMRRHAQRFRVASYKMDFEFFGCEAEGHGHLPGLLHGFEANVDALIEILRELALLKPDLILTPTSGMWSSPWWLRYANMLWPQGMDDFDYDRHPVSVSARDWELTYRDENLYQLLRVKKCKFPFSGITFCAPLYGPRYNIAGPYEDARSFANAFVFAHARQIKLAEKATSSPLNSFDEQWDLRARTLAWALARTDAVPDGTMILGRPTKGELYAYSYLDKDGGIVALRNPSMRAQGAMFSVEMLDPGEKFIVEITYPFRRILGIGNRDLLRPLAKAVVGPYECMVVEVTPFDGDRPLLEGCRYRLLSERAGGMDCEIFMEPGTNAEFKLVRGARPVWMEVNGKSISTKTGWGRIASGVKAQKVEIMPLAPRKAEPWDGIGAMVQMHAARLDIPKSLRSTFRIIAWDEKPRPLRIAVNMGGWFGGLPYRVCKGKGWTCYEIELNPADMNVVSWGFPPEDSPAVYEAWLMQTRRLEKARVAIRYRPGRKQRLRKELPTPFADVVTEAIPITEQPRKDDGIPWIDEYAERK